MKKRTIKYFKANSSDQTIHKHSIYMQSKDSHWLNKNLEDPPEDDFNEPIEEDIRD